MDILSILILIVLGIWFVFSIYWMKKEKGKSCNGACSACSMDCRKKDKFI
ncbi:MAG: FeoB-associated Cys-rich membrane protein [Lachnospiraceae bacterium]|nr:FeoB-associated Cys-rich membrane protein [Lachnospiraceae bacterium]